MAQKLYSLCHLRDEFNTCNFNVWPEYSTFSNEILEILCAPKYAKFKDIEFLLLYPVSRRQTASKSQKLC